MLVADVAAEPDAAVAVAVGVAGCDTGSGIDEWALQLASAACKRLTYWSFDERLAVAVAAAVVGS